MVILTLLHPQQRTPLKQWVFEHEPLIKVGRAAENHVVLDDLLVSRFHLELRSINLPAPQATSPPDAGWHLVNRSSNGTFVNGYPITQGVIADDIVIQLAQGGPLLRFQQLPVASPLAMEEAPPAVPSSTKLSCNHAGNAVDNLFCIHCGQPVYIEKTIHQYQVLRVLGRGGMGTTYLVWNPNIAAPSEQPRGALQVLKEMNADIASIPKAQELFEREANTLKTLNHPGIPKFYDFFVEEGKKYLVMELLHGQDMEKRVRKRGPVAVEQAINWMIQTCDVLEYLHNRETPIIHRDIKPGNLLVQNLTNRVIVLDFGAVKAVGMPSRTRIGAEGYSAPEQIQGRPVTQSDLFAIGPSLVFLLTGQNPTRHYKKGSSGYRLTLPDIPEIPLRLRSVIERVTAPHLGDRYRTAEELAQALAGCL
jgi:serine/threonine-protein kinase